MKKTLLMLALGAIGLTSCNNAQQATEEHEAYKIVKFENNPYLAEVWWGDDYDPEAATQMMAKRGSASAAGCTSWRQGQYHGRNIDWTMQPFVSMIIHMPAGKNVKYASVGVTAGTSVINKDLIDNNEYIPDELKAVAPAFVVDGINEKGVCINHNIVPYDKTRHPEYEKNGDIFSNMLCRYVLDNCATAKEAVDSLQNMKVTQGLIALAGDYSHFMISDAASCYVVEWVNNEFVATEFLDKEGNGTFVSDKGTAAVMTNYFVAQGEKYGVGTPEFFKAHPCATGVERADTVKKQLAGAKTVEDNLNICRSVWYKQFCEGKTQWYTENAGLYNWDEKTGKAYWCEGYDEAGNPINIRWRDDDDVLAAAHDFLASDFQQNYYKTFIEKWNKPVEGNTYWFTQHSVVYDVKELKGYIVVQEGEYSNVAYSFGIK